MSKNNPDFSNTDAAIKIEDMPPDSATESRNLRGTIVAKFFLLVAGLILALGFSEVICRYLIDTSVPRYVSRNGKHWNQDHPVRGYTLTPGYQGRLTAAEFDNRLEFNSLGLRGPELKLGVRSAFVLGDSFVFGVGAEFDETIGERFAVHLQAIEGRDLQVWNLGVPSYTFQQYLSMLEEHLQHCIPEVVILCVY